MSSAHRRLARGAAASRAGASHLEVARGNARRHAARVATEFIHRWLPGARADLTLLLLHGTGGNEDDLVPLGEMLAPGAPVLSPRGPVLENGMPRFFRRLAEGVFDVPDLIARSGDLAAFVGEAAKRYGFGTSRVVAVGFSNGANVAASVMLLHPEVLAGAVLLRAMVPLSPTKRPDLSGRAALIASGRRDPIVPLRQPEELAALLREAGADVEVAWSDTGHELTPGDLQISRAWLEKHFPPTVR